jgi:hypothetical protein
MNRDKPSGNVVLTSKRLSQDFFLEPLDQFGNGIGVSSCGGAVVARAEAVSGVQLVDPLFTGFDEGIDGGAIAPCDLGPRPIGY